MIQSQGNGYKEYGMTNLNSKNEGIIIDFLKNYLVLSSK